MRLAEEIVDLGRRYPLRTLLTFAGKREVMVEILLRNVRFVVERVVMLVRLLERLGGLIGQALGELLLQLRIELLVGNGGGLFYCILLNCVCAKGGGRCLRDA